MASLRPSLPLSVVILTLNEAHRLEGAVRSVQSIAHECLILDAGSTDGTTALATQLGCRVLVRAFDNEANQRQFGLEQALSDWVLFLDADEQVSERLAHSIQEALSNPPPVQAFDLPFSSYFLGQTIRFGAWWNERHTRLLYRPAATIVPRLVHTRFQVAGRTGRLVGVVHHNTLPTLSIALDKMLRYATLGAEQLLQEGRQVGPGTAFFRQAWSFVRNYLLRLGFLDGWAGLALAFYISQMTWCKYLLAFEKQRSLTPPTKSTP